MRVSRVRLAALWISQVGRNLADNCLRLFVILKLSEQGAAQRDSAWHISAVFLMLPAIFLCPVNGALSNSLPKRNVLAGSAAWCLAVIVLFGLGGGPWLACWALLAIGIVLYGLTRYALLPAAAHDARLPLTRVNGLIELGAAGGVVAGAVLGGFAEQFTWPELVSTLGGGSEWLVESESWQRTGWPIPVTAAALFSALCLLMALPAAFPSDVRRPEAPGPALTGFFRDALRILACRPSRFTLLGMAGFRGLLTALTGAIIALTLSRCGQADDPADAFGCLLRVALWTVVGVGAGSLLAGAQAHPSRAMGLVPVGACGLLVCVVWAACTDGLPSAWLCFMLGVMGGAINVPLSAGYQDSLPADARGNGMAVRSFADYLAMSLTSLVFFVLAWTQTVSAVGQLWLLAALLAASIYLAVVWWGRDAFEQLLEFIIWPMYRIRSHGPGLDQVPHHGPLLIVANHTAYLDPVWLAKIMPRRLTPMMTSLFYDKPILHFFMSRVFHVIRVEWATFRRQVPELDEAVKALDRGQCVLLFPEGWVKRTAEMSMRPFGRGVWRILEQRPDTPVVVCWIEGGWGSYTSYDNGPPLVNKALDFWRPIEIAVERPRRIDPEMLADQRATRRYLMEACLSCRRYLGLETRALPEEALAAAEEKE